MTTNQLLTITQRERSELVEALYRANSRLLGALLKMENFINGGLDVDLPTTQDVEMTRRAYEESKEILKKYKAFIS